MVLLTKAHQELFRRSPDESFSSFEELYACCDRQRQQCQDLWRRPDEVLLTHDLTVCSREDGSEYCLNDWSFSQLCRMANVRRETVNRLSSKTASRVLAETLPHGQKPLQILTAGDQMRCVHGVAYTRLWNTEVLDLVQEFASDFTPPQVAGDGTSTGLYCGEQDMFAFMIDPAGWAEIDGQAFAPGFFVWNSEVGRRSLGIQTFWFQAICQNHIVWDATEVVEFSRKHTAKVREGLGEIRQILEQLVAKRDQRRDSFVAAIRNAMSRRLGQDRDEVTDVLLGEKIPRTVINEALEIAHASGGFTIFSVVDALTKLSQRVRYAGDRTELDARVGQLLSLAV